MFGIKPKSRFYTELLSVEGHRRQTVKLQYRYIFTYNIEFNDTSMKILSHHFYQIRYKFFFLIYWVENWIGTLLNKLINNWKSIFTRLK